MAVLVEDGVSRLVARQRRLTILSRVHPIDGFAFQGDHFGCRKRPAWLVLGAFDRQEFARVDPLLEVLTDLADGHVAHAARQGIAQHVALLHYGLTLQVVRLRVRDGVVRPRRRLLAIRQRTLAFAG